MATVSRQPWIEANLHCGSGVFQVASRARTSMRGLCSLVISLFAVPALAAPPLRIELEFHLMRNGTRIAEVVERLEQRDGSYELTEQWRGRGVYALLGRAKRVSRGSIGPEGPRPDDYMDERSGRDTQRVRFDWKAGTITRRYKGDPRTEPVPADTQDRLSFLLAFAYLSKSGKPIAFHVADGRGMSHHTYKPNGRERIALPAGEFDTVKVIRKNEGSGDVTEFWFAANLHYLPIRGVVMEKDGTRFESVLTRISQ
jgi:uncharacterized protein DUF3108